MEDNIFNLEIEKPKPRFIIKEESSVPAAEKKVEEVKEEPKKEEPKKEEPKKEESKKEEPKKIDKEEDIVTLTKDLYIRQYPGTWEHILTYKQIKKDLKKNIIKGQVYAILKAGTSLKIEKRIEVIGDEIWGKISSGYILLSKGKDINYK